MDSTKSPRQLLQALCAAWRRYIALPHGRANMDEIREINLELPRLPPDSLMAIKASRGSTRDPLVTTCFWDSSCSTRTFGSWHPPC